MQDKWLKKITSVGFWYALSSFISKGMSLLLVPITTKYLTTADYGLLNNITSINQFISILGTLYLDAAFIRYYHEADSHFEKKRIFSNISIAVILLQLVCFIINLVTCNFWIYDFLGENIKFSPFLIIAFSLPLIQSCTTVAGVYLKQLYKSRLMMTISMITLLIGASSTYLFLVNGVGWFSSILSTFIVGVFNIFFWLYYLRKVNMLTWYLNFSKLKEYLRYSIPLMPNIIGLVIANIADRFILTDVMGLKESGLYSFAVKIAFVMYVLQDAITQVTGPLGLSGLIKEKKETLVRISDISLKMLGFMIVVNLIFITMSKPAIEFIAQRKEYVEAYKFVGILGFTYVLQAQYRIFSTIISYHKKMWVISVTGISTGIINIIANYLLIPSFGIYGACFSTILSFALYTGSIIFWAFRLEPLKLDYKKSFLILFIFIIFNILYQFYFKNYSMLNIVFITLAFCISIVYISLVKHLKWIRNDIQNNK